MRHAGDVGDGELLSVGVVVVVVAATGCQEIPLGLRERGE